MRFNKLDLNLLVALDAMLQQASITKAAAQLHISQSAMSNCLARLREYFDDPLLVRVGRRLELTHRAQALRDAVRDLLQRIDTTVSTQPQFDPTQSDREFRIAASDYSALVLIPRMLALASAAGTSVRFSFLPQVGDPATALERGDADLLVIPTNYCSSLHPYETIFEESYTCLVWSGSELAKHGITMVDYEKAGHVVMKPAGGGKAPLTSSYLEQAGIQRRIEITTYSFLTEPAMVIGSERIATVHSRLADVAEQLFPVTRLPTPIDFPVMEQAIQWHKYRATDPGINWLIDLAREAAAVL